VFLRAGQMALLDKLRADTMAAAATCIQRHVKGHQARSEFSRKRDAVVCVQSWARGERQGPAAAVAAAPEARAWGLQQG
jgi:myosin-5